MTKKSPKLLVVGENFDLKTNKKLFLLNSDSNHNTSYVNNRTLL